MSIGNERAPRTGYPVPGQDTDLTSFVGRRGAPGRIKRLLSNSRLVTLTGVVGVGKTRLAGRVVREVRRAFPGGVLWVALDEVAGPDAVVDAVAAVLLNGSARQPRRAADEPGADLVSELVRTLARRRALLVLDGCEHLLPDCGDLARELLSGVPALRVLTTSQRPLDIAGEQVWTVAPLRLPAFDRGGEIIGSDAVRLFIARAAAVAPGFVLTPENEQRVAELCRELDGLPLAIEQAAAWMRTLSVEQLAERVTGPHGLLRGGRGDVAGRQRSLWDSVAASHALCDRVESAVWSRLSVFSGTFDLDAAEEVCAGEGLDSWDVFTGVTGLVDKSVLTPEWQDERTRYRLLRTIREYGAQQLGSDARCEHLRRRHRDHFLRMAEDVEIAWLGPNQAEWLGRLRADHANFGIALDYGVEEPGEVDESLRMAAALWFYWVASGQLDEGRDRLRRAWSTAAASNVAVDRLVARVAVITALLDAMSGDVPAARDAAAAACSAGANEAQVAHVHGVCALLTAELDVAEQHLRVAVAGADERSAGAALGALNLALVVLLRGQRHNARELCARCQEWCIEHGELWCWSWADVVLALVDWDEGAEVAALTRTREALRLKHLLRDVLGTVTCLEVVAWVESNRGRCVRAARLFAAADAASPAPRGYPLGAPGLHEWRERALHRVRVGIPQQQRELAWARGAELTLDEAVREALGVRKARSDHEVPLQLTPREREVARLVARGMSNREIAERLVIAKRTSDSHVEHILAKLGFTSRAQIASWVAQQHAEA